MSNTASQTEQDCGVLEAGEAVELLVKPHDKDLGGFTVRRLLPTAKRRMVGPWVFFDHMGPAEFGPGPGVNVRPHPHIGLSTVTYLFEGEIFHRDSLGNAEAIVPGDINLMVAGKGIVHSERERRERTQITRKLNGLQLWLALPESLEQIEPAFYHYSAADIPSSSVNGVDVRVLMGSAYGLSSPVKCFADTLYVEATLKSGQSLELPPAEQRALYIAKGEVKVGDTVVPEYGMAFLKQEVDARVEASKDTRIALVGGEAFTKRHIDWNFVATDKALIEQAKLDWKEGRFAKVVDDEQEYIPLPE